MAEQEAAPKREHKAFTDVTIAKAKWKLADAEAGPGSKVVLRDGDTSRSRARGVS